MGYVLVHYALLILIYEMYFHYLGQIGSSIANSFPAVAVCFGDRDLPDMHSSSRVSFTHHPATVGETYAQHFHTATGFCIRMIGGGLACLVHAIFPFLFETTGSSPFAAYTSG